MDKREFQGILKKIAPYILTTLLFAALVGLAWAQSTEAFYYSYDNAKQLRRAMYVNRTTSFPNHTTAFLDYVYDNMGNR